MKVINLLIGICMLQIQVNAQYYAVKTNGTNSEYNFNISCCTVTLLNSGSGTTLEKTLSPSFTLPFNWKFYGVPVSAFKVSTSGYLTFDSNQSTDIQSNTTLPNAEAPRNAIFAFWDSTQMGILSNYPSDIRTWTYGVAPKRVCVIQWRLVHVGSGITNVTYFAIRLYEGDQFDIVENYGMGQFSATIGCQNQAGDSGYMVKGSPELNYGGNTGSYIPSKSDVYHFYWGIQPYNRITFIPPDTTPILFNDLHRNINLGLYNAGKLDISKVYIHCRIDHSYQTYTYIDTFLLPCNSGIIEKHFPVTHIFPADQVGIYHWVEFWIEHATNGSVISDTFSIKIFVNKGITAPKKVLLEELEGAWCGYTPFGDMRHKELLKNNPGSIVSVTIHNSDGMSTSDGNSLLSAMGTVGFPATYIDRIKFPEQSTIGMSWGYGQDHIDLRMNEATPVNVVISNKVYNPKTRTVDYDVQATFVDYAIPGDIRISSYITEDLVRGPYSTQWNQRNYYSSMDAAVGGTTHPLYSRPDYIPGYYHNFVLRAMPSGIWGVKDIIPNEPEINTVYTKHFTYIIPPEIAITATDFPYPKTSDTLASIEPGPGQFKVYDMKIVGFVSYYNNDIFKRYVLNATDANLPFNASEPETKSQSLQVVGVFPNPVTSSGSLQFNLSKTEQVTVELMNIMGQSVRTIQKGVFTAGAYNLPFEVNDLESGIYMISVSTESGREELKLVVGSNR